MTDRYDVIVIGAGPAGMMAAGTAARQGARVLLLEKNQRVGRKLLITGKGRCNITNNCDTDEFMKAQRRNPRFLYSAINAFTTQDAMKFFEEQGVPLKTERGNRVFPVSDQARDVVDALAAFVRKSGVQIAYQEVDTLLIADGQVTGLKTKEGKNLYAPSVIIATGGLSYPLTGCTGDGYRMAQQAGHTIIEPTPSLIPIVTREKWCADVMGLSLKNVTFIVKNEKDKVVFTELGEMLFTHFGISGPLVLSASSHMTGNIQGYTMFIDLKPGLTRQQLDARVLRDFDEGKNRSFKNSLDKLLPKKLIPIIIELCGIDPEIQVNEITKEMRSKLIDTLKALPLVPKAFRPIDEAIVTSGGIKTTEIDPKTMMSKLCGGLFFAGEVMDLDAYTGGFNLQIAYSTGVLAGMGAAAHNRQ